MPTGRSQKSLEEEKHQSEGGGGVAIDGGIRVLPFGVASTLFQYSRDFCAVMPGKKEEKNNQ